ncbi:MAG: hypothetical protein E7656_02320 [Ruminococcaceae bacterium]|nr:hypothetical protein [Oscillospiraceae bacterium]
MKKRNASSKFRRCFALLAATVSIFAALVSDFAYGDEYNDAWFNEYANISKTATDENVVPNLFKNDKAFENYKRFPLVVHNNVHYVPLEMFLGLADTRLTYGYSSDYFYLSRERSSRYISFDVENNLVTTHNLEPYTLETKLFHSTRYIPVAEVAKVLGITMEIYENRDEGVYALRLSDSKAKLSFSELIKIYSPIKKDDPVLPPDKPDPPVVDPVVTPEIGNRSIYLSADVTDFRFVKPVLSILEYNIPKSSFTFFVKPSDILKHPDEIRQIIAAGQNVGFLLDAEDPAGSLEDARENLRLVAKCSSRLVRFSVGSSGVKLSDEEYAAFVEKYGVRVWDYNISSADKPDMYEKMYGELYNLASNRGTTRAVFRITPGTNTVSALRRLFESVRAKDQLVIMSWDETTRNYTVR